MCVSPFIMCMFMLSVSSRPSEEQLHYLENITEIRGALRIQGWSGESFPYLKNLKYIGSANGTKISIQYQGRMHS